MEIRDLDKKAAKSAFVGVEGRGLRKGRHVPPSLFCAVLTTHRRCHPYGERHWGGFVLRKRRERGQGFAPRPKRIP